MHEPLLTQIGLEPDQAAIYEIMLKAGPSPARKIALQAPYKRPYVYKVLKELIALGLAEKKEEREKVAVFSPLHPVKLREIAQKKLEAAQLAKTRLDNTLGTLISDFNLISGKPGVQFFEGKEGVEKVSLDSLTTKDEILTIVDSESTDKYIRDVDSDYIKKREKLGIKKRILAPDSESIRLAAQKYKKEFTQIKILPRELTFSTATQIYDDKVSLITMREQGMIAVLIQDPLIAETQKKMFEFAWRFAKPLLMPPVPGESPQGTALV